MRKTWSDNQLVSIVPLCNDLTEIIKKLGLRTAGGNFESIKGHIKRLNISTAHFNKKNQIKGLLKYSQNRKIQDKEFYIDNSRVTDNNSIRRKVAKDSFLDYICQRCENGPTWNNEPLTLQLDHINGKHSDHRKENLRWMCPNCHSQTNTFAGRNKRSNIQISTCLCGNCKLPNSTMCRSCNNKKSKPTKINWPDTSWILQQLNNGSNYSKLGRELGVTDTAVRKRIKTHNIEV